MLNNTIDYRARQSITKHAEIDDMIEQLGDRVAELERVEEKVLEQQLQIAQLQEQVHAVLTQGTISTNTNTGKAGGKPTNLKRHLVLRRQSKTQPRPSLEYPLLATRIHVCKLLYLSPILRYPKECPAGTSYSAPTGSSTITTHTTLGFSKLSFNMS